MTPDELIEHWTKITKDEEYRESVSDLDKLEAHVYWITWYMFGPYEAKGWSVEILTARAMRNGDEGGEKACS